MAVASSTLISQAAQADGQARTREQHTTDAGTVVYIDYDCPAGGDAVAIASARAAVIWQQLLDTECEKILSTDAAPQFVNATKAVLVAYVRKAYQERDRDRLAVVARWVLNRISDGTITDAQAAAAFSLNAAQWLILKNKMQNLVSADNTVQSAVGE